MIPKYFLNAQINILKQSKVYNVQLHLTEDSPSINLYQISVCQTLKKNSKTSLDHKEKSQLFANNFNHADNVLCQKCNQSRN
jgi:hypothetical protein